MVAKKKHKPPSKIKYAENHPSVTILLSKTEHKDLVEMSFNNDKSINQMLKEAVGLVNRSWKKYQKIYEEGSEAGYEEAIKDFSRNFKCSRCGRPLMIKPTTGDELYTWLVQASANAGWHHSNCKKQPQPWVPILAESALKLHKTGDIEENYNFPKKKDCETLNQSMFLV